jgi:tetratricopeptide (TPR) repeat protein
MGEKRICGECGAEIPLDAPQGLCLQCLAKVALSFAKPAAKPAPNSESDLERIRYFGDYELLEEIARGGMGVVYRARQVSLNRIVAVKMLLFGRFASDEFVKRFQTEAEAAANLQHPNIVAIHEIGEHEDQHYFSMEHVTGQNLAQIVRDNPVPAKRAAGYVKVVAEAIHCAHQQGVLHRDLKPSNILIDQFDHPRITDFGLAKRLKADSDATRPGQVLGTPNYMPPEQADFKRGSLGTYSDIYSLGAILYHLLTGRPPFAADTLEHTIFQLLNNEPVAPRLLVPDLPRDLETICLKCLRKEPDRRYQNAQELAEDLGHFLAGEPVRARPVSRIEAFYRWAKRKPAIAGLSAAVFLILLAGTVVSTWQAVRARRALGWAQSEIEGNDHVVEFLRQMLQGIPQAVAEGRDTAMMQELVDKAADRMDQKGPRHHRAEANLREIIGRIYLDLRLYDRAETMFTNALATEKQMHGNAHPHVARYLNALSMVFLEQGRLAQAEAVISEALKIGQKSDATDSEDLVETHTVYAYLLLKKGKLSEAETHFRQVLEARQRRSGSADTDVLQALNNLSAALLSEGKLEEGQQILEKVVTVGRGLPDVDKGSLAIWLGNLAAMESTQGHYAAATELVRERLALCQRSLGPEHPRTLESMIMLGRSLKNQRDEAQAELILRQVLSIQDKLKHGEDVLTADALDSMAAILQQKNQLADAETVAVKGIHLRERLSGRQSLEFAVSLSVLAGIRVKQQKLDDAEQLHGQALAIRKALLGPGHFITADSMNELAVLFRDQRRFSEADAMFLDALGVRRKAFGPNHPDIASTLYEFAGSLQAQHKLADAVSLTIEALNMRLKLLGPEDPVTIETVDALAKSLAESKRFAEADERFREVLRARQKVLAPEDPRIANELDLLASVLWEEGKHDDAESTFRQALPTYLKLLNGGDTNAIVALDRFAWAILARNGKAQEAEQLLRLILATERRIHGNEHPIVAERLNNFAEWQFKAQKQFDDAEVTFIEALSLRRKLLGDESAPVADSLMAMGRFYGETDRWYEAEKKFREALTLEINRLGKQHLSVIHLTFDLATTLEKQGKHKEAEPILLELHELLHRSPEETRQGERETIERLQQFYSSWASAAPDTGKMEKALEWERKLTRFSEPPQTLEARPK